MEKISAKFRLRGGTIKGVADDRVFQACQVDAYLMSAASADADFEERESSKSAQHFVFAPGRTPIGETGCHSGAMNGVARDGPLNAATLRLDFALDQSQICLGDLAARKLSG